MESISMIYWILYFAAVQCYLSNIVAPQILADLNLQYYQYYLQ